MPPEALLAQAESQFVCISGETKVYLEPRVQEIQDSVAASLEANCPGMTLITSGAEEAAVALGGHLESQVGPWAASVPFAVEAGIFAISSSSGASVILSPETISGILTGEITAWNDPLILADNDNVAPLEGELVFNRTVQSDSIAALEAWYKHYTGNQLQTDLLEIKNSLSVADYTDSPEGSIAFMPSSIFNELSITSMITPMAATISPDKSQYPQGAVADFNSIQSGASQWASNINADGVLEVIIDFEAKAIPPSGFDVAPSPYQIIYPLYLRVAKSDDKVARAVARYLLRQDSQGLLTLVYPLPTAVRAEALALVSQGLVVPSPQP